MRLNSGMLVLGINTASFKTSIALIEKGKSSRLLCEDNWQSKNNEAEKLMPKIQKLLTSAKKDFSDIKGVFVIKGPGSFTGLRVGVTVANAVAYLNKTKLYAADTFEYWFEKAKAQELPIKSAQLVFAGSQGVYVIFKPNGKVEQVNLMQLHDFLKSKKIEATFGDITDDQIKELKDIKFIKSKESFGETATKMLDLNPESLKTVKPKYVKSPGITKAKCYT